VEGARDPQRDEDPELAVLQEAREIRAQWLNEREFAFSPLYTYGLPSSLGVPDKRKFFVDFLKGPPDGTGAYRLDASTVRLIVQAELNPNEGWEYEVNGGRARLRGSVIQYLDISAGDRGPYLLKGSGLVYDTVFGPDGRTPISSGLELLFNLPLNAKAHASMWDAWGWGVKETSGLVRLCSASLEEAFPFAPGEGTADRLYISNQESTDVYSKVGAVPVAVDLAQRALFQLPALGFGVTEKSVQVATGEEDHVAFLTGHYGGALHPQGGTVRLPGGRNLTVGEGGDIDIGPFDLLYVGRKDKRPGAGFLERNGLREGALYVYVDGRRDREGGFLYDRCGSPGETFPGRFVRVPWAHDPTRVEGRPAQEVLDYFQREANEAAFLEAVTRVARGRGHTRPARGKSEHLSANPREVPDFKGRSYGRGRLVAKAFTNGNFVGVYDLSRLEDALRGSTLPEEVPASMTVVVPCHLREWGDGSTSHKPTYLNDPDSLYWLGDGRLYVGEDTGSVADKLVAIDPAAAVDPANFYGSGKDFRFKGPAVPQLIARASSGALTAWDRDDVMSRRKRRKADQELSGTVDLSWLLSSDVKLDNENPFGYYGFETEGDGTLFTWGLQLHGQYDTPGVGNKGQIVLTRALDRWKNFPEL
jgi:hypothetical protein